MKNKILEILKKDVDPILSKHYGGSTLTKIENGVAYIKLTGACASCPSSHETIETVVKGAILGNVVGINDVILDNSVSQDLIDFAKKFMNHNNFLP